MWFFDTPGTPGGASIVERNFFWTKQPLWICWPYKETHLLFTKLRRRGTIWPQCVPVYQQLFIANTYKVLQNGTHWGQIVPRRISFVNTICWPYQETHLVFTKLRRRGTIWPQCVPVYEQLFIANTGGPRIVRILGHQGIVLLQKSY